MLAFGILNRWTGIEYIYQINRLHSEYRGHDWQGIREKFILPLYLLFVGPIVGIIFFGFIAMKFGRKTSLLCMSIPMIVSCNELVKST